MTSGNHIWDKKEALDYVVAEPRLLRPLNYPAVAPGRGTWTASVGGVGVAVVNAMGRVHMPLVDDPFAAIAAEVERLRAMASIIIVDFHAEATSEKIAMGWHLDGRTTAVVGTHTHVQTADERVLPGGTAYITDVGMTGPHDSVIGMRKDLVLTRFVTGLPESFKPATSGVLLQAVLVEADAATGKATRIERISVPAPE